MNEILNAMIGKWTGEAAVLVGGNPARAHVDFLCQAAGGGTALRCEIYMEAVGGMPPRHSTDLIGIDARGDGCLHWFSAASDGEVYERQGHLEGRMLQVEASGLCDGRSFQERVTLRVEPGRALRLAVDCSLGLALEVALAPAGA